MTLEDNTEAARRRLKLVSVACGAALLAGCSMSTPQPATASAATASAAPSALATGQMTLDTPVGTIAADPRGKAILDHDVPGLTTNPNYPMIKMMTLPALQSMSGGQMTQAEVNQVKADLAQTPPAGSP